MDWKKNYKGLERLYPRSLKYLATNLNSLISKHLWAKIVAALILGIVCGYFLNIDQGFIPHHISKMVSKWLSLPGDLFLKTVQMVVVPLVFSSIIKGVAGGRNVEQLKQLGIKSIIYFLMTTIVAISIGVVISNLFSPGKLIELSRLNLQSTVTNSMNAQPLAGEWNQMLLDFLPINPLLSLSNSNMIQIVIFAVIFGAALVSLDADESAPLLNFLSALQSVCMKIVSWAMYLAPLAVFGMTAKMASTMGRNLIIGVSSYIGTVIVGLLTLALFYSLLLMLVAKKNFFTFLKDAKETLLLAFSTSSSATVMPLSIKTATEKLKVKPSTAEFVIPVGATINMDGTAIYQIIATIFLAQAYHIDLSLSDIFLVSLSALGASIGSPGTPGVGIVILSGILASVNIPLEGTAIIMSVDRILDMCRTTINVMGDLTASLVLDKFVKTTTTYEQEVKEELLMENQRTATGGETLISKRNI